MQSNQAEPAVGHQQAVARVLLRSLVLAFAWMALGVLPAEARDCGGKNQRACCVLEDTSIGECEPGLTAVGGCDPDKVEGDCTCGGLFSGASATSHCEQRTKCGGENQRACCVFEAHFGFCKEGLAEIPGCGDGKDCLCGGESTPFPDTRSSGTCIKPTPCGAAGQRACIVFERQGGRACDEGLTEVPRCAGDCFGKGSGSSFGVSSGMCARIEAIVEPTTNRTEPPHDAPTTASPSCPLYGYADLHLHLFADRAHGKGVLAGKPYDVGGVNKALGQCVGSNLDLVDQDLGSGEETSVGAPGSCSSTLYPGGCGTSVFHGDHGITNDAVGSPVGTRDGALEGLGGENSNLGAPIFNGWPRWTSTTHQQAYYKWLERAWQGGLRLTTMLAVTNEALCKGGKHARGTNCEDSMASIELQIDEAKAFEKFIDEKYGLASEKKGWFRIVYTPAEARLAIAAGKLAVVLGIETAELFNCKFPIDQCTEEWWTTGVLEQFLHRTVTCPTSSEFDARGPLTVPVAAPNTLHLICTPELIRNRVQYYAGLGVRHVFPIHNFDNGFGGAATWQDAIEVGNRAVEKRWWDTQECPSDPKPYGFKLGDLSQFFIKLMKFGSVIPEVPPDRVLSTDPPSCNTLGLLPLGESLITALMDAKMLIDVDHMSRKAFDKTLDMAEARSYPGIVASHVLSFDLHDEEVRHERMRTKTQLQRIKGVGGMIAAMLKDEVLDTQNRGSKVLKDHSKNVANDCRHSSKAFAQAFEYAVDVMQGPVALGSDFNGVAGHFGPRFGSDACGGLTDHADVPGRDKERSAQYRSNSRLKYPFTLEGFGTFDRQKTGQRTFDYNTDGLAHVGLLPDFVADLRKVGLPESDLDMLFRSAEAYIQMWEGAEGTQPAAGAPMSCTAVSAGPDLDVTSSASGLAAVELTGQTGFPPESMRWSMGSQVLLSTNDPQGNAFPIQMTFPAGFHTLTFSATRNGATYTDKVTVAVRWPSTPGAQGLPGATGAIGPQGPQGATGAPGAIGPQGPVGPVGAAGAKGPQGDVGAQGSAGPSGPSGPQGSQGPAGPAGTAGAQGPAGPAGAAGATGPQGLRGDAGSQGATGPAGATGALGPLGDVGPQGPAGLAGAPGSGGPRGPQGEIGPQGAAGVTGGQGPTGPAGSEGARGAAGAVGLQGPAGVAGATGAIGVQGARGESGPQGQAGPAGATGPAGIVGATGPQGAQGVVGGLGPVGPVGPLGPQGPAGLAGPQGPGGARGLSLVPGSLLLMAEGQTPPSGYKRLGSFVEEKIDPDGRGGKRRFRRTIVIWQRL